ncbi:MAG TPA: hypothetical protein DCY17_00905 [Clostridiales bacterium]|nr:hypothetical protein [Clostridiales bacterium]
MIKNKTFRKQSVIKLFSAVYCSIIRKHAPERSVLSGACLLVLTSAHGQFPSVYYRLALNIVSVPPAHMLSFKKDELPK